MEQLVILPITFMLYEIMLRMQHIDQCDTHEVESVSLVDYYPSPELR